MLIALGIVCAAGALIVVSVAIYNSRKLREEIKFKPEEHSNQRIETLLYRGTLEKGKKLTFAECLTNKWIHENLFKDHIPRTSHDYLGDYNLLGEAWLQLKKFYDDDNVHVFVAPDGVYQVNNIEVIYSGSAYDYAVQCIWCIDLDCPIYKLPLTPMACIYGAIVMKILEEQDG